MRTSLARFRRAATPLLLKPSQRGLEVEPAHIAEVEQRFAHITSAVNLGVGGVRWAPPHPAIMSHLDKREREKELPRSWSQYGDVLGTPPLLDAIREAHNLHADQGIVVTAGANQAMVNIALLLMDPGDSAILIAPYYFSHRAAVDLAGGRSVISGFCPDTLQPDIESVRQAVESSRASGSSVKMVVLTTPNNPSGVVTEQTKMQAIEKFCASEGIWLVVDEAYADFIYGSCSRHVEPQSLNTIRLRTFSKNFGMAGWRCGYAIFPSSLSTWMVRVQDAILSHAAIVSQDLALHCLQVGSGWVREQVQGLTPCREALWNAVEGTGAVKGSGAYYFLVPLPEAWRQSTATEDAAFRVLAEQHGIIVTPGRVFGAPGTFRATYGSLHDEACFEAAARLHEALSLLGRSDPNF